ncbi:MAG: cysteine hydrolase [Gammaproteobacteria bacterium]|nr:cysteine hydrolase [Gammaproteobacteria bacterium]
MPGTNLTRDVPLLPGRSALLVIDVQNFCCHASGGMFAGCTPAARETRFGYYERQLQTVAVPNMQRAIAACRARGVEVIYTTIEALTADGRDQSLDYKISGILVPKGSWEARVIAEIAPAADEIFLPKTASSVFNATNVEYVLRNLGVERLAIMGVVTDQCVESAVRDACDRGFLVTLVTDACATLSQERHDASLRAIKGYCRQVATAALVAELSGKGG